MNKMILYKEWLKTRWVLLGILLVFAAIGFYCFLNLSKVVEIRGGALLCRELSGYTAGAGDPTGIGQYCG